MTLYAGDLTTVSRLAVWLDLDPIKSGPLLAMQITAVTDIIYSKLSRSRLYSQQFTRFWNGPGTPAIVLPDYPLTSVQNVQIGSAQIPAAPPPPASNIILSGSSGYGWRVDFWNGNLPGEAAVLQLADGFGWRGFWVPGIDNVQITYTAGYLIQNEPVTVPIVPGPYTVTVAQPQGIWARDNGVVYAATGIALVPQPIGSTLLAGQYISPADSSPGLYTFAAADAGQALLVSYSFVPASLELACQFLVGEYYSYRSRIGLRSKSLGGQETMSYQRGGIPGAHQWFPDLPPEVNSMIAPYVSTVPPVLGPVL